MDLWIRSQDKEKLLLINTLAIADDTVGSILGYGIDGRIKVCLGDYGNNERALEVLDEIQKLLQPIYKVTNDFKKSEITGNCQWVENQEYIPIQCKVYEMPEN